ncbi:hypothetical protein V6N13_027254 [Hibiscus sabdariffa]|uniref:Uncharacterized protein n=1 Tax=Hibiscus sabdariffa TaxID=183260 RepID=A0ABR2NK98_9ROSI
MESTREQQASLTRGRSLSPPPGFGGQRVTAIKGRKIFDSPPSGFEGQRATATRRRIFDSPLSGFGGQRVTASKGRKISNSPPPGFGGQRATATKRRRINSPPFSFGGQRATAIKGRRISPPDFRDQRVNFRGRSLSPPPGFEEHHGSTNRARNVSPPSSFERRLSPLAVATLQRIREKESRGKDRKKAGSSVEYFDNTDPYYSWLLAGWVAEERIVPSGRLYRYYYDPSAHLYRTKYEILYAWETMGLVCLDL